MKKHLIFGMVVLLITSNLRGQNFSTSPYSVFGLGLINSKASSLNQSMGFTGIGLRDESNINLRNPASYNAINSSISHIYEGGFTFESNQYNTSSQSSSDYSGGLSHLNYWFRFSKRWASTVGLSPFSRVSYNVKTTQLTGSGIYADYLYKGSGNITQLYFGNAYQIVKGLSVGINVSYLFGTIDRSEALSTNGALSTLNLHRKFYANTFDLDFGIQYEIPFKKGNVTLGLTADDGLSLSGREKLYLIQGTDTLQYDKGSMLKYTTPRSAGFGSALTLGQSVFAADVKFAEWSKAVRETQTIKPVDTWTWSVGYQYKGSREPENYLQIISLRGGMNFQNYQLKINGKMMTNYGLTAGLSFHVFDRRSFVNLNYSYQRIGTTDRELIKQASQTFSVDIVFRDLWGQRRKFD